MLNEQGDVTDVKIVHSLGHGLDEEVSRAVKLLPQFQPGKQNGKPVALGFTVSMVCTPPVSATQAPYPNAKVDASSAKAATGARTAASAS